MPSYERIASPAPKCRSTTAKYTDNAIAGQRHSVVDLTHDYKEVVLVLADLSTRDNIAVDKPSSSKSMVAPRKTNEISVPSIVEKRSASASSNSGASILHPVELDSSSGAASRSSQ